MKRNLIFCLLLLVFCCCGSFCSSSSPILEKLAAIRTKTSPDDQKDAVYKLIERFFSGRGGDFVMTVNQSHFALKYNMDAFEYESSPDGMSLSLLYII